LVGEKIKDSNFFSFVYPESVWEELEDNAFHDVYRPPRNIFLPSNVVLKAMVMANLKFAQKDTEEGFLARFGIYEHLAFLNGNE